MNTSGNSRRSEEEATHLEHMQKTRGTRTMSTLAAHEPSSCNPGRQECTIEHRTTVRQYTQKLNLFDKLLQATKRLRHGGGSRKWKTPKDWKTKFVNLHSCVPYHYFSSPSAA